MEIKTRKENMERRSLIVIIVEKILESFSLSSLMMDISFVPERLNP
jgi:hypothetical protein